MRTALKHNKKVLMMTTQTEGLERPSSFKMTPNEKRASMSLASVFALRMLGLFLILPVFAVYASHLPGGENAFYVGLALGTYGLTQCFLQIPFGLASDRFGRKPVIVAGLLLFIAGSVVAALANNIWWVIAGRAIQGAGAISAAVTAYISDSVRESVITKAMAMVGASIGVTFALSLVIAPPLANLWGVPGLFWITALMSTFAVLAVLRLPGGQRAHEHEQKEPHQHWSKVLFNPQLLRLNAGIFFLHAAQMSLFVVVPPRLVSMGLPVLHHWYIYLPAVLLGFAIMFKPIVWAEKSKQVVKLLRTCVALLGIVFGLFTFLMHSIWEIAFLMTLFFACFNILEATLPGLISRTAPKSDKGLALGIYNTTQSLGLFIGGAVGGWLSQHFSAETVFIVSASAMLVWFLLALGQHEPVSRSTERTNGQ